MTTSEDDKFLASLPPRILEARKYGYSSGLTCDEVSRLLEIIDGLQRGLRLADYDALEDRS